MKKRLLVLLLAFVLTSSMLTACNSNAATPASTQPTPITQVVSGDTNSITVNSSEEMSVVPDMAEVVFSVTTQNKDAAACQTNNSESVTKVIALLKELGIAETSIQTSDYYMQPIYNYSGDTKKLSSYQSSTTLTISDLAIDNLGEILTKSVSTGINTVESIRYFSSKYDENYQEALKLAVASAKAKAQALADAGSCTLGSVITIQENSNYSQARYTDNALANRMQAKEELSTDAASMDIMPGEIKVAVTITVEYQIQ